MLMCALNQWYGGCLRSNSNFLSITIISASGHMVENNPLLPLYPNYLQLFHIYIFYCTLYICIYILSFLYGTVPYMILPFILIFIFNIRFFQVNVIEQRPGLGENSVGLFSILSYMTNNVSDF